MSQYFAPVRDIRFTLDHIVDFPAVTALEPFAEVTPDLVDAILNEAGRFASEVMAPSNVIGDRQGCTLENGMVLVTYLNQLLEEGESVDESRG